MSPKLLSSSEDVGVTVAAALWLLLWGLALSTIIKSRLGSSWPDLAPFWSRLNRESYHPVRVPFAAFAGMLGLDRVGGAMVGRFVRCSLREVVWCGVCSCWWCQDLWVKWSSWTRDKYRVHTQRTTRYALSLFPFVWCVTWCSNRTCECEGRSRPLSRKRSKNYGNPNYWYSLRHKVDQIIAKQLRRPQQNFSWWWIFPCYQDFTLNMYSKWDFWRDHETFVENLRKWEFLLGVPDRWFWLWKKDQLIFVSKSVFSHWFGTIVPPPQTRTSINLKKRGYLRVLRIVSWHMPKNCPWEAQWAHNLRIFFCDTIHNGVQYILQGMLSSSHSCICPMWSGKYFYSYLPLERGIGVGSSSSM